MDKEKEIEEIKDIIEKRSDTNLGQIHGTKCGFGKSADVTTTVSTKLVAQVLVSAGYGNVKESVKKFADRLIALYENEEGDETHYSTPCPVIIQNIKDIRDEFLTELYGTSCETCPNNNNAEYNESNCPMRENCGRK